MFLNYLIVFLGLAQLDAKQSGRLGSLAIMYYFATTILAVIVSYIILKIITKNLSINIF